MVIVVGCLTSAEEQWPGTLSWIHGSKVDWNIFYKINQKIIFIDPKLTYRRVYCQTDEQHC